MNLNGASQNQGLIAWNGTVATPIDIRRHVNYSFTFKVTADLAADAVFNVQSAPASDVDICVPGTFAPVPEVLTCMSDFGAQGAAQATIVLPSGTKAGAVCTAALPCRPNAFVRLATGSGPVASVLAVAVLSGPK
jgi:hypothetical protein